MFDGNWAVSIKAHVIPIGHSVGRTIGVIIPFFPKELKASPQLPFHKRRKLLRRVFYWVDAFCTENRIRTMKEADTPN